MIKSSSEDESYSSNEEQETSDDLQEHLSLKCLAPLEITYMSKDKFPEPISAPWYNNVHITDVECTMLTNGAPLYIFDKYYRVNKDNHHVWTNNLIIKEGTKIDQDFDPTELKLAIENHSNIVCDLKRPENSFYLKKVERMGNGLFARHNIPQGMKIFMINN